MILYHGTIREYANRIVKEGLKPMPKNAFHANGIPIRQGFVYLTGDKNDAMEFAIFRAFYTKMEPNTSDWLLKLYKRADGQPALSDADATPVIITLDVPEDENLMVDPDAGYAFPKARVCACEIPAKYVKEVIPVK